MYNPGSEYIGNIELLKNNKVKQSKPLFFDHKSKNINPEYIKEINNNIIELLNEVNKFNPPKYYIIRINTGSNFDKTIENIKLVIKNNFNIEKYDFIKYDQDTIEHINDTLHQKPNIHTFIFIKEKLRCAITLDKTNLGILYERYVVSGFNDTTVIQGLLGRLCGYYNNNNIICYTNISSIEKYELLWMNNFDNINEIGWKSNTTGKNKNKKTVNGNIPGFNIYENTINNTKINKDQIKYIIKQSQQEMENYYNENLRGIFKRKLRHFTEDNGFYYLNKKKQIKSINECRLEAINNLSQQKNQYRYFCCYENINDKNSVRFMLCYIDKTVK
jgi:hypothetical protein